ncbi:MAG: ECF-type sigma factor, partial [Planctomycetota bacterium]
SSTRATSSTSRPAKKRSSTIRAWLRLQGQERWNDRLHFVRTAARAMRRVLVDHARSKGRERRGGEWDRVDLDPALAGSEFEFDDVDLLALDEAMTELEALSERQARIVELRFFAGLEVDDVARVLDVSTATVGRDWRFARAWLAKALDEG